jgi:hypothetical protein
MPYVRCGSSIFRLDSVMAMASEEVEYRAPGESTRSTRLRVKLLIAGEWVSLYGVQAERLRDYLSRAWIAQGQLVHLDAPPQEPPTAAAESPPTQAEPAPAPAPEPEKRRHFL